MTDLVDSALDINELSVHTGCMKQLSTREVRREFSKWLWHVRETGESILITHYGRPYAVLAPPPPDVAVAVADPGTDTL